MPSMTNKSLALALVFGFASALPAHAASRQVICSRLDDNYTQTVEYVQDLPDSSADELAQCRSTPHKCGYALGGKSRDPQFTTRDKRYAVNMAITKDYAIVDLQVIDIKKGIGFSQYDGLRVEEGKTYQLFVQQKERGISSALISCGVYTKN